VRILIAEDDGASRLILKRSIQKLGYECEEAENGDQAWDLFVAMKPNVIISDWMMPGRDGVQLCQAVRAYPNDYYPYFMLLTALDDKAHTVQALEAGADDYLLKPLDRDDLQARLIVARRVTGLHGQLMEQKRELERLNAQLYEDGRRDPLTKIGNRLRMQEDLEGLAARASRYGHQFCLALCDVDDRHGSPAPRGGAAEHPAPEPRRAVGGDHERGRRGLRPRAPSARRHRAQARRPSLVFCQDERA